MKRITIISLLLFVFSASNSQAQIALEFFTAKEGYEVALKTAKQNVTNPKLVNIITINSGFSLSNLGTFYGEYKYSGEDIGKSNIWLYTFSPDGDQSNSYQVVGIKSFLVGGIVSYPLSTQFDFTEYGVNFAFDKYIDVDAMLDSDEFTKGLLEDELFDEFQNLMDGENINVIGIGAVKDSFSCVKKDKISWMRYLQVVNELGVATEHTLCCATDYDNINNLACTEHLSILDDYSVSNISIFPTPAKDFVTIYNPAEELINSVSIYDINGQIILTFTEVEEIDISTLAVGNYYVCFELGSKKIFRSLIKN